MVFAAGLVSWTSRHYRVMYTQVSSKGGVPKVHWRDAVADLESVITGEVRFSSQKPSRMFRRRVRRKGL